MLFYRPVLTAYQRTADARLRRFLLRELTDPRLHAEPGEILRSLRLADRGWDPAELVSRAALDEWDLRLRLTVRDPAREMGGLWTTHAAGRALVSWSRAEVRAPALSRAASSRLLPLARGLLHWTRGTDRAWVLLGLGYLGGPASRDTLRQELLGGALPSAAAVGLSLLKETPREASAILAEGVEARGFASSASWLGATLPGLLSEEVLPLLWRLARSQREEHRELAARAVEGAEASLAGEVLDALKGDRARYVRLNALASLGRLGVPGGLETLRAFCLRGDPEILHIAALQAAGRAADKGGVRTFLREAAMAGSALERSEALASLVTLGAPAEELLDAARSAVASSSSRLFLMGLLALCLWEPEEAFRRVLEVLQEPASGRWTLATYALRYLDSEATVPLLSRLCKISRDKDLEEVAAGALCRHLARPSGLACLLDVLRETSSPVVLSRIAQDMARHLPGEQVPVAAEAIRQRLGACLDTAMATPLLEALGALGTAIDLPLLSSYLDSEAVLGAVAGTELLMDREGRGPLKALVRSASPVVRNAALVGLFRLGDPRSVELLEEMCGSGDDVPGASRALYEMALSVRCVTQASRLSLLYEMLAGDASVLPKAPETDASPEAPAMGEALPSEPGPEPIVEGEDAPGGPAAREVGSGEAVPGPIPEAAPRVPSIPPSLEHALATRRPRFQGHLPSLNLAAIPERTGEALYTELGRHLEGRRMASPQWLPYLWLLVPVLCFSLIGLAVLNAMARGPAAGEASAGWKDRPPALGPALTSTSGGEPPRPVAAGDIVEGGSGGPVLLQTRLPENRLIVEGAMRVEDLESLPDNPRNSLLTGVLLRGAVTVDFRRGRSVVRVAGPGVLVRVDRGKARLELEEDVLDISVVSGQATVRERGGSESVLSAHQKARFRAGRRQGEIERFEGGESRMQGEPADDFPPALGGDGDL